MILVHKNGNQWQLQLFDDQFWLSWHKNPDHFKLTESMSISCSAAPEFGLVEINNIWTKNKTMIIWTPLVGNSIMALAVTIIGFRPPINHRLLVWFVPDYWLPPMFSTPVLSYYNSISGGKMGGRVTNWNRTDWSTGKLQARGNQR